jgi:CRP-like cAMP-binding protein
MATSTSFFDGLSDDQRRELRRLMQRRRFERGEVVFHEGDPGASLHVIESGWFLVHTITAAGERVGMTIQGPGDVFGELSMLDANGRRTATIRALRPAVTMSLDSDEFHRLRDEVSWIDRFLIGLLVQRVERLTHQLAETAWLSAEKRVCRQLYRLVDVFDPEPIYLKQAEIAQLAQTTRPTVSSVLGELAKADIVRTGRGSVEVLDRDQLAARV